MHPYIVEHLARDHMESLDREAQADRLAREARGAQADRLTDPGDMTGHRAPGPLGRAVAILLGQRVRTAPRSVATGPDRS